MKHLKIFSNKNEFEDSAILISRPFVALDRQTELYTIQKTQGIYLNTKCQIIRYYIKP